MALIDSFLPSNDIKRKLYIVFDYRFSLSVYRQQSIIGKTKINFDGQNVFFYELIKFCTCIVLLNVKLQPKQTKLWKGEQRPYDE